MRKPKPSIRRRGAIAVFVVISLLVLLGVVAIAADGGVMLAEKRQVQAGADAAALAGVADLMKHFGSNAGFDPDDTAVASAKAIAKENGYDEADPNTTLVVRKPDEKFAGGPKQDQVIPPGYIEVTISYKQQRFFSMVFGTDPVTVSARAVARGTWAPAEFAILVLDPTAKAAMTVTGNGVINTTKGAIVVNSDHAAAVDVKHNALVTTAELNILGGYLNDGTIVTAPTPNDINTGVPAIPDPLWYLEAPDPPELAPKLAKLKPTDSSVLDTITALKDSGKLTDAILKDIKNVYVLEPGRYDTKNKLDFSSPHDLVIFKHESTAPSSRPPGLYYLENGIRSQNASLLMYPGSTGGMMFYNAGTNDDDSIQITGNPNGVVSLVGMESGPYENLLVFQNRMATQPVSVTGNGFFEMVGTFYAANAKLTLTGNGSNQIIGSQLISRTLMLAGNGNLQVLYQSDKVTPQRVYQLVQ